MVRNNLGGENMYKVKMKSIWSGPGINHRPNDVLDLDDLTGKQLVDSGSATLIEIIPEKRIESAIFKPPETAMMPKPVAKSPAKRR